MKKTYYILNSGRMSRSDNTLKFEPIDDDPDDDVTRHIPVEGISDIFCFGSLDANSALYNFLGKSGIAVHFFDYYENYTGSFMPKPYLLAGQTLVEQTRWYLDRTKRMEVARLFVRGAAFNLYKNLQYYNNRDKNVSSVIDTVIKYGKLIVQAKNIPELMGIEGNIRQAYYTAFDTIISTGFKMGTRSKRPPLNEINALISFGNMMCYALCINQVYHTQLHPSIGYLHEPGYRRQSLALDIAEIFRPVLVDRLIFRVLNKREIQAKDFEFKNGGCLLKESGRRVFVRGWDERVNETIHIPALKRNVSYKYLVRQECHKLANHILGKGQYEPFKARW